MASRITDAQQDMLMEMSATKNTPIEHYQLILSLATMTSSAASYEIKVLKDKHFRVSREEFMENQLISNKDDATWKKYEEILRLPDSEKQKRKQLLDFKLAYKEKDVIQCAIIYIDLKEDPRWEQLQQQIDKDFMGLVITAVQAVTQEINLKAF